MEHSQTTRPDRTDELLRLLADGHRRAVLTYVRESSTQSVTFDELVDAVCTQESTDRDRIRIRLYHATLPRLDDTAVVDYDTGTDTVSYEGDPRLEGLMDAIDASGSTELSAVD